MNNEQEALRLTMNLKKKTYKAWYHFVNVLINYDMQEKRQLLKSPLASDDVDSAASVTMHCLHQLIGHSARWPGHVTHEIATPGQEEHVVGICQARRLVPICIFSADDCEPFGVGVRFPIDLGTLSN